MRQNIALLIFMVFALSACGAHGGRKSLKAAATPVIQDLPSKTVKPEKQPPKKSELSLVLSLPKNQDDSAIASELDIYKAALVGILKIEPRTHLRITAHSALLHSQQESMERSKHIALAVKNYLLREGAIDPARIRILPRGAEVPLFANSSAYGRARNNRMELTIENISDAGQSVVVRSAPPVAPVPQNTTAGVASPPAPALPAPSRDALARTFTFRFSTGRSGLDSSMLQQARELAQFLQNTPGIKARIVGHTDNVGSRENNQRLSYQRALELQIALLTRFGIPAERTEVKGYGEDKPLADNSTSRGRSLNRRVEIRMLPYKPVVRYAGIAPQTVVPGESAAPAAAVRQSASAVAVPQGARKTGKQDYRQRLEQLAKLYGAREVIYSGGVRYVPLRSANELKNYRIEISVGKCTLWLYRVLPDGSKMLMRPYKVATAKKGVPYPQGTGYVTAIDYDPWWFPTARMIRQAAAKGRRLAPVPPGSRSNPMGAFKIYLSHGNNGGSFRIHGTNRPSLIGRRVSQGCIRMTNKDGLELARTIEPGTEVVVYE